MRSTQSSSRGNCTIQDNTTRKSVRKGNKRKKKKDHVSKRNKRGKQKDHADDFNQNHNLSDEWGQQLLAALANPEKKDEIWENIQKKYNKTGHVLIVKLHPDCEKQEDNLCIMSCFMQLLEMLTLCYPLEYQDPHSDHHS